MNMNTLSYVLNQKIAVNVCTIYNLCSLSPNIIFLPPKYSGGHNSELFLSLTLMSLTLVKNLAEKVIQSFAGFISMLRSPLETNQYTTIYKTMIHIIND